MIDCPANVASPGATPLIIVTALDLGTAVLGLMVRRSFLLRGLARLAGAAALAITQAPGRNQEVLLVLAGVSTILGTAWPLGLRPACC